MDIRTVKNSDDLIRYFIQNLDWNIDEDDFNDIDDITYDFDADDLGLKKEEFSKISSLKQLQPISENQKWGIFCVEFDSKRFEVSAIRKILSKLVPTRRNAANHAVWAQKNLLFLCFWGNDNNKTIGIAHFEDKEHGLPQIKMITPCAPAIEERTNITHFEERLSHLKWIDDENDTETWYRQWSSAFVSGYREVIRSSHELTVKLAKKAREIRKQILDIYTVETDKGYIHEMFKDFKESLIHDLDKERFADMYAQTIVYGLFSARCMDNTPDFFNVSEAVDRIPNTNPFLKKMMKECIIAGNRKMLTFDELDVSDVVDLLQHTNDIELILKDFNRMTGGGREDPVIHFYEEFLSEYDKEQKIQRGVYYTPQPVVNFMVRAVDDILKKEFNLKDGLASEETKEIMVEVDGKKRRERRIVPAVQILDPATGTGTFLHKIIWQIYDNFCEKHEGESEERIKAAWNEYVPKHLLPRLNGFELMMAPYAVAHMKLAMVLKDTGYDFGSDERLNVFLTNSLEEPGDSNMQLSLFEDDPLASESVEANQAKKNNAINVIIGNPPYSGISSNNNEFITNLINDYKYIDGVYFNERKHWLNDDYVKFIRLCEEIISKQENGILAFINNHAFLDNPTFRCMRYHLLQTFEIIYIIDLHGNVMKKEISPNGEKDENVFDIMQGVSINIFVKKNSKAKNFNNADVFHSEIFGTRNSKYTILSETKINYKKIQPNHPFFFFIPKNTENSNEYDQGFSLQYLFLKNVTGIVSARDNLVINFSKNNLLNNIQFFSDLSITDEKVRSNFFGTRTSQKYLAGDTRGWSLSTARRKITKNKHSELIHFIDYRPFDKRFIYYSNDMVDWGRESVFNHMIKGNNIALIIPRQAITDNWSHVSVSDCLVDNRFHYSNKGIPIVCPLYLYDTNFGTNSKIPNLNLEIIKEIENKSGFKYSPNDSNKKSDIFSPIDLLDYIYAVLHSPKYREKYKEFLKIDFPRVPYPTDKETFWKLVEIGSKLRECHLMHTEFDIQPYNLVGYGTNEVVKPEYKNGRVYISKTQYFDNVPQAQWEQYIGGYQPLQKWLKDRKKTILSSDDIEHYKKIIAALKLTQELMAEIDNIVDF